MNTELIITLCIVAGLFTLLALCIVRVRQPPNPMKPRLLPYGIITIFITLALFLAMAHTVSILTGHKLEGRTKMKGQR